MSSSTSEVDTIEVGNPISFRQLTSSFLKSGEYSDMVLRCEGKDIKVHKVFVCNQSKPIAAGMSSRHQTCEPGVFELLDSKYDVASKMVEYMYTGSYTPIRDSQIEAETSSDGRDEFGMMAIEAVELYIMGDRYDIQGLKAIATENFQDNIAFCYTESLVEILRMIYTQLPETDLELKEVAMEYICAGRTMDMLLEVEEFNVVCAEIGEIGLDIIKAHRKVTIEKGEKERKNKETSEATRDMTRRIWCSVCGDYRKCACLGWEFDTDKEWYDCTRCGSHFMC